MVSMIRVEQSPKKCKFFIPNFWSRLHKISLKMEDLKILQERSCSKIQGLRKGLTLWVVDGS